MVRPSGPVVDGAGAKEFNGAPIVSYVGKRKVPITQSRERHEILVLFTPYLLPA